MYLVIFGGFYWAILLYLCCTRTNKKGAKLSFNSLIFNGRDTRIRTWDPLLPKQVR